MVSYRVFVDKSNEGYCSIFSDLTDPDNLVPHYSLVSGNKPGQIPGFASSNVTTDAVLGYEEDWTLYLASFVALNAAWQERYGWNGSYALGSAEIPISASSDYTLSLWLKDDAVGFLASMTNCYLHIKNQAGTSLASTLLTGGASYPDWTRLTLNFTTGVSDTYVYATLESTDTTHPNAFYYTAGWMVTPAHNSAPTHFNLGAGWENNDITSDAISVWWQRGMENAYDAAFADCEGEIILDNQSGNYWPSSATWLKQGTGLWIAAEAGLGWQLLGRLAIREVYAGVDDYQKRQLRVRLQADETRFFNTVVQHKNYISIDADNWFTILMDQGNSGSYRIPFESIDYRSAKKDPGSGQISLGYLGDQWADGVRAIQTIETVAFITRCRVWFDRFGRCWLWEYPATETTAVATITAFEDIGYSYGENLINFVRCRAAWRTATGSNTILWQSDVNSHGQNGGVPWFAPSESRSWNVRLKDANFQVAGMYSLNPAAIQPNGSSLTWPTYNAFFNSQRNFGGTKLGSNFTVSYEDQGSVVRINVTNNSGSVGAYGFFTVGGVGLLIGEEFIVFDVDTDSVDSYGPHMKELLEFIFYDDVEALSFCQWYTSKFAQPREFARFITLTQNTGLTHILNRDLFDVVTIQESSHSGLNKLHCIISERHEINLRGEMTHKCVFGLEEWVYTA